MTAPIDLLSRTLARRDRLAEDELDMLRDLRQQPGFFPKGSEIIAELSRPSVSCLLATGLSARAVTLADGRRQLTALHVPGDFVDLHALLLKQMDHSVIAMSDCNVVFVPHADLLQITQKAAHLTRLLWLSTTIDAAIQREMIASIGRRTPLQHLAHLICELYLRLETVGLAENDRFQFLLTQAELADVLGLSLVHTNRTVQELRATGYVAWERSSITILNPGSLQAMAGFDPTYLSLQSEPR